MNWALVVSIGVSVWLGRRLYRLWRSLCFVRRHRDCGGKVTNLIGASDLCTVCKEPVGPMGWKYERVCTLREFCRGAVEFWKEAESQQ